VLVTWLIPYLISKLFPFSIGIEINDTVFFHVLFFVLMGFVIPNALVKEKLWQAALAKQHYQDKFIAVILLLSYLGVLNLFIDLYLIRGLNLFGDILSNRLKFEKTGPSLFGYLSYVLIAASFLLLTQIKKTNALKLVLPIVLICALYLMSGNRQIMLSYILIFAIHLTVKYNPKLSLRNVFLCLFLVFGFFSLMVGFHFLRQNNLKTSQLDFFYAISEISPKEFVDDRDSVYLLPLVILYQYFGLQYHGMSAVIDNKISTPPLSRTAPVLYRRASSFFNFDDHQLVLKRLNNEIEHATGMYPRFWMTKFSQIYTDYGYLGFFYYSMFFFAIVVLSKISLNSCFSLEIYFLYILTVYQYIFGVMFIPYAEPVIFTLFAIVLLLCFIRILSNKASNSLGTVY
jgi:hypothetical protein